MIYILEFEKPLGDPQKKHGQAKFYLGYCEDERLAERLLEHQSGKGASITRAAFNRQIGMELVVTLPGDRKRERQLKRQKNTPKIVQRALRSNKQCIPE